MSGTSKTRKRISFKKNTYVNTNSSSIGSKLLDALHKLEEKEGCPQFLTVIAHEADVNFDSARPIIRRLKRDGKVFQRYPRGPYSLKQCHVPTHGVAGNIGAYGVCPRVQNWDLRVEDVKVSAGLAVDDYEIPGTGVGVCIRYGWKRKRVTVRVSCSDGLSLRECKLVVREIQRRVSEVLKCYVDIYDFEVKGFELLNDYDGVRLDLVKCATVRTFLGLLEKIYQKDYGVRHEIKAQGPISLATFYAMVHGGPAVSSIMAANFMLVNEVKRLFEQQKRMNEGSQFMLPTMKGLVDGTQRIVNRLEAVEKQTHLTTNEMLSSPAAASMVASMVASCVHGDLNEESLD